MLCDELKRLKIVKSVCCETVRQVLKKQTASLGGRTFFCIAEADRPRFVARMEAVLDVYQATYDDRRPLICMDEASRQVLADVTPPLPMKPGVPRRIDDKYERHEVRSLLLSTTRSRAGAVSDVAKAARGSTGPTKYGSSWKRITRMPSWSRSSATISTRMTRRVCTLRSTPRRRIV